jgi:hypothetical protein
VTRLERLLLSVFSAAVIATAGVSGAAASPFAPPANAPAAQAAAPDAALPASHVATIPVSVPEAAPATDGKAEPAQLALGDCASAPEAPSIRNSRSEPDGIWLNVAPSAADCTPAERVRAQQRTARTAIVGPDATTGVGISGTVTNAATSGLPGIYVYACGYYDCYRATTAANGTYTVGVAPNDSYIVYFDDPSGTYATGFYSTGGFTALYPEASTVNVTSSDVSGINITLPVALHITGLVTNSATAGLPNIYVNACVTYGFCYSANTAANGTYSVAVAPNESYILEFTDLSGAYAGGWYSTGGFTTTESAARTVTVALSDVSGINITLPVAIHITGTVTNAATVGLPDIGVLTCIDNGFCYWTTTAANGTYSVGVAPNEGYILYFYDPAGTYADGYYSTSGFTKSFAAASTVGVASSDVPGINVTLPLAGATYVPLNPSRVLDTRNGTGLSGPSGSHAARTFQVTGQGGVPSDAVAVTGNLTVTGQTSGGYLFLGPVATNDPTSSTINFPVGDDRANGVTVALGSGGTLGVTFVAPNPGPTAHVIFDVTGYFLPDSSGATYMALTPSRVLDTRNGTGLSGPSGSHAARTFQVTGQGGVPSDAVAVTGNLTVTGQTSGGYLFLGPVATNDPTSSTINFPVGDDRANGVTVALGSGGTLGVTFVAPNPGPTAHVIFDVTGYFTFNTSGSTYFPLNPSRILDTRNGTGLAGPSGSHAARTFNVSGQGGVPAGATAVTGNLTVTGQTSGGFLFLGPESTNDPTSSTLNFPVSDDRANGVTVALGTGGKLSVTFVAPAPGPTAHVIFDVTGYFVP